MPTGTVRESHYVVADWQAAAFGTGPADRARAEAGVAAAYASAGLDAPERYIWVPSPARGAVAAAVLAGHGEALSKAGLGDLLDRARAELGDGPAGESVLPDVRTRPWEVRRAAACSEQGPEQWPRTWAGTGGLLWNQVQSLVTRIRAAVGEQAHAGPAAAADASPDPGRERTASLLRAAALDAVLGQHDAPWLALFESLGRLDGPLAGLAEAARSAGWWWPYERLVILSERPRELHRDEPGRLHRGDGPALAYPDGFALHAWRGMPIPPDFVASLTGLTAARISSEPNAELRRVMLEIFGYDRYLAETGARPLHRDETGVLWSIDLPGDEPVVMVEVVNSTPEPDGTHRTYYLRVPPGTRTARAGVAWTFGVDEADYVPEKQT
ncbi:17 kDa surface antigen family protein [Mycobacterium tuberculosis]|nr:17 kDa surface antigen family protein [Mycobacterium tuberculosis]